MRVLESCPPGQHLRLRIIEISGQQLKEADDSSLPANNGVPIEADLADVGSKLSRGSNQVVDFGGLDQGLLWNSASIDASPAQWAGINQGHTRAYLRCLLQSIQTGGAAADDDEIIFLHFK